MFLKKIKIAISLIMLVVLTFTSAGCVFIKKDETAAQAVELYYVKKAYINGEIDKDAFIMYKDAVEIPEELFGRDEYQVTKYMASAAIRMLKNVPSDIEDEATTVVSGEVKFKSVDINNGVAVVNIDSESLQSGGGSTEESLFISQIVSTLMNSIDGINGVKFLVDGKEQDSLMGHIDISEKFVSSTIK